MLLSRRGRRSSRFDEIRRCLGTNAGWQRAMPPGVQTKRLVHAEFAGDDAPWLPAVARFGCAPEGERQRLRLGEMRVFTVAAAVAVSGCLTAGLDALVWRRGPRERYLQGVQDLLARHAR